MANYESGFDLTHVPGKGVNHEVFKCLNLFFFSFVIISQKHLT